MAPSTAYIRASTSLNISSNPSVLRSLASTSIRRSRNASVRTLWWWSRHGTWSSANDESIEERIQRHQKIMRHRYSRALRRRATWDRDDGTSSSWLWPVLDGRTGRKWVGCRTISSTDPKNAKVEEKHDSLSSQQKLWAKTQRDFDSLNKDFESFKAAVDRAVARDPYETLFGRRLQSPPSENNSSWISWLFNRGGATPEPGAHFNKPTEGKKIAIEVLDGGKTTKAQKVAVTLKDVPTTSVVKKASDSLVEYIYDPISGRKVPKESRVVESTIEPKLNFLGTLFFKEHGAEPDKPVEQPRIYGHDSKSPKQESKTEDMSKQSSAVNPGFESSRTREYQQLRAATLGTSIDTTAEFGGKFATDPGVENNNATTTRDDASVPQDTAPLFSGTAYEAKAWEIVPGAVKRSSMWLAKEGFRDQAHSSLTRVTPDTETQDERLQPALDRIQQAPETAHSTKFISKLQPAIDRVQLAKAHVNENGEAKRSVQKANEEMMPLMIPNAASTVDTREDVDLLRASDVRAATKAARTTKQEIARAKSEWRNQLETDFDKVHKQSDDFVSDVKQLREHSSRSSRSLDDLWRHAEQHPDGIVAKTMKSIGMVNDKPKDRTSSQQAGKIDLTKPLEFSDGSLEKLPSIHKNKLDPLKTENAQVDPNVREEELARQNLTESLRLLTKTATEAKRRDDVQIEQLANGIRQVYESEHGPIDLSLAQSSRSDVSVGKALPANQLYATSSEQQGDFFAERNKFLSEVSQVAEDVGSIKTRAAQLETDLSNNTVTPLEFGRKADELAADAESCNRKVDDVSNAFEASGLSGRLSPHPLSTAVVKPGVPRYPMIERHTTVFEPQYIQTLSSVKAVRRSLQEISTSLHDLKRSKVARDEPKSLRQPTPKEDTKAVQVQAENGKISQSTDSSSPYLILVYNKSTGEIDQTTMNRLPWLPAEKTDKSDPIKIMGSLNYPAAFVTHFAKLEKAGYGLTSGGGDMLVFQKAGSRTMVNTENKIPKPVMPASRLLRNNIATEEASAQPEITETIAQPKGQMNKEAATVLDEIPTQIPTPGPAAPTAPPPNPLGRTSRPGPKIRRQESVFSGTIPVRPAQPASQDNGKTSSSSDYDGSSESTEQGPGFVARTARAIKRGVVGVTVFGVAAYTIGVVAEGIGAQAQVDQDTVTGPRTKIVMPTGQRPGIYSTESSRD